MAAGLDDVIRVVDAAARATEQPAERGVVLRRGRSTLIRFGRVLARVRTREDRAVAEREVLVARALDSADVPAIRPAMQPTVETAERPADRTADRRSTQEPGPLEVDDYVITLWQWIERAAGVAQPAETGRLGARLHNSTAAAVVRGEIPLFDPLGATRDLLHGDQSADAALLARFVDELTAPWSEAITSDPLGTAIVHGDLHAENVLVTADGPVLVDLELAGTGPPSYDAAPMAVAVDRYGADPSSLDAFLRSWPADPRLWPGFQVCCRVYEAWVTAWAVSQRDESSASHDEADVRIAALRGEPSRAWTLR